MTDDETNRAAAVTGNSSSPQAADIRDRWWWVEHSVWTERMLTRLEQSEPTTKWFRLWDKVLSERNLQAAFWAVWRNDGAPGVDGQTVKQFDEHAETELARLREELHTKRYRRQAARRVRIPKPGTTEKRPLGIPAVRDRSVEGAARNVLEPIFERDFAEHSYGVRPGHGRAARRYRFRTTSTRRTAHRNTPRLCWRFCANGRRGQGSSCTRAKRPASTQWVKASTAWTRTHAEGRSGRATGAFKNCGSK